MSAPDPRWLQGVDLFNREEFFEAHEVVEDLWNETDGREKEFLKGFIQAAVSLEHHRRGNPNGLRSVGTTAAVYLGRADPGAGGLDVAALLRDLDEFRARAERGENPPYPRARWNVAADTGRGGGTDMSGDGRTAMEKSMAPPAPKAAAAGTVRVTPAAADRVRALVAEQEIPADERSLRIAVRAGGCSGFSYEIGFDRRHGDDAVFECEGIAVIVDAHSLPHLAGIVVDFVDTVQEQGFKIQNPNAKSSCGCGQSFQA